MANKKMLTRGRIQFLVGVAVSVLLLSLVFRGVSWDDLIQAFRGVDLDLALLATIILVSNLAIRSLRWRVLLTPVANTPTLDAFSFSMIGYLVNNVLPFRLGEFIRAGLLGEKLQASKSGIFATVVVERLFDVLSLLVFVAILTLSLDLPSVVQGSILIAEVVAIVAIVGLAWLAWRDQKVNRLIPHFVPETLRLHLIDLLDGFIQGLRTLTDGPHTVLVATWSVLSWGLVAVSVGFFLHASGLGELPWHAALLVIVVTNLGSAIPTSPGFVGGYHFLAVFSLSFWSVPRSEALSFAILVHGVNYIVVTLLGLLALWRENIAFGQLQQRVRARIGMVTERSSG